MPNLEGRSALDQVKILKDELTRQRRLNIDLEKQVTQFRKAQGNKQLERVQADCEKLQEEKEQLKEDLEKSETIRTK
jgi:gas vesicle protein